MQTDYFFSGTVDKIIFANDSNFFKILLLILEDTNSDYDGMEIIITGSMAEIIEGEDYTFWGELSLHPKYGEQVKSHRYERQKPSASGLIKYFSSQEFKGIGKKTAEKIVALYGQSPIDAILEDPSKLDSISGLSKAKKERFLAKLKLNYGSEIILTKLAQYGINPRYAMQIFEHYKEDTLDVISDNPYQLVEDIVGIGFKTADQIALQLGLKSDSEKRFRAALLHSLLTLSMNRGDTYIEARELLETSLDLLESSIAVELDPSKVAAELSYLIETEKVQHIDTKIFDNSLYFAEAGIHKHLKRLLENPLENHLADDRLDELIDHTQESLGICYDDIQKQAIKTALTSKVFILTGGPGTGKTTVINGIITAYAKEHQLDLNQPKDLPIILAAPTGRASRRMNELTGLPSATIHRHLGLTGESDFQLLDEELDGDLIIIDEFSMVDTWLANKLFAALSSDTQVIIVGDSDQLPSVGPGQVLADLLAISDISQIALEKIFRQSKESTIITLASQIRQGIVPDDFTAKKPDRSYFEAPSHLIPQMISTIVQSALKSGINAQDIQILAPMYRGQAGIDNLNTLMQDLLNPLADQQFLFNDLAFRIGDKVLHLINDAEHNVFNGDIGYITDLIPAKYTESKQDEIIMDFDGQEVIYPRKEWRKITLAYAMSIHKSQGSEFQVVILPITAQSQRMLERNLIYTAITRSKSKLILLGEFSAFDYAISTKANKRHTYLVERFLDLKPDSLIEQPSDMMNSSAPKEPDNDTFRLTEENYLLIDPMIGITQEDIETLLKPQDPNQQLRLF
ncbi:ATP-dependent RecD-like DNA helicase [Streptococcus sp. zg-JUN1979]|uniref:SF1B family DNA helicase RecD2 n=1 Tax=Streptococcus sp. zg-JUN1979 TaxID=3391450 RepID=UPI0039A7586B